MANDRPRGPGTPPRSEEEPPYEGLPGRTTREAIHVPLPNGFVRTVQVYRVVNVATDPQLREPALASALHRFDSGEHLAIPYVFHDPSARKMALVVPDSLRHEQLSLRAKHVARLADHADVPIPPYVAEATTVIGVDELKAYLERPPGAAALAEVIEKERALEQRAQDVAIQSDALAQREARLKSRAEEVTRREDELRMWAEELEMGRADLALRENELEARFEALAQREAELASRSEQISLSPESADVQLVDEVEELDELEPLATTPGTVDAAPSRPPPSSASVGLGKLVPSAPPSSGLGPVDDVAPLDADALVEEDLGDSVELVGEGTSPSAVARLDEAVEELEDDEVEELDEIVPIGDVTGVHADVAGAGPSEPPPPPPSGTVATDSGTQGTPPPLPSVAPPRGFLDPRAPEATAVPESGGVRMFARLPPDGESLFEDQLPDLLIQLVVIEEYPVVLLTLVQRTDERPTVLRAALDPKATEDRRVLENLRRTFEARVGLFAADGSYLRAIEVVAPREVNVAHVLDRVGKMRTASPLDAETAIDRVRSAPPPIKAGVHPFAPVDSIPKPKRAVDAAKQLASLAAWRSNEKLDHALLVLSIPADQVEAASRRILEDAAAFGLPFPGKLHGRAVSLGLAPDGSTLLAKQIEAFRKTASKLGRDGLSEEQVAEAWETLLAQAAEEEYAIDADTHELAWKAIRKVRGADAGLGDVDLTKLPGMEVGQLVPLLEHPRYRKDAALELAGREDASLAEVLCKATRKMPRAEVVRVAPQLAKLGEDAGDALIDGLNARKTFVRQAFALSLGHLKLRRAVVPLLHLLGSEESEVWREIARVLGSFGTASMRTVSRALKDPKGQEQRFILTLAHLANHGCAKQVDKLTSDERPAIATMAIEALTLRDRARVTDEQVHGKVPLTGNDPILKFSHRFYAELEGKAPGGDLEEG